MQDRRKHTVVRSQKPGHCPHCKQDRFEFVLLLEGGSRCVECHVALTTGTRPKHVAEASWQQISLELHLKRERDVEQSGNSISLKAQERRRGGR